jgi:hypothetical protein
VHGVREQSSNSRGKIERKRESYSAVQWMQKIPERGKWEGRNFPLS